MTKRMSKPLIGITSSSGKFPDWGERSPGHIIDFVHRDYSHAVEVAGGIPILIPVMKNLETAKDLFSHLDGLLLPGGQDVSPRVYGEEPIVGIKEMDYHRDLMEIEIVKKGEGAGLPILGICRGIQLLNVAFGGTLYQDIYKQMPGCLDHSPKASKKINTHKVHVLKPSRLYGMVEKEMIWVNSQHHQAIKDISDSLVVTAKAGDGIIEAIEGLDYPYLIGVQWHPEGTWHHDEVSMSIFSSLVKAAKKYAESHHRSPSF